MVFLMQEVNPDDYPILRDKKDVIGYRPGSIILETEILRAMRWTTWSAFLSSPMIWWVGNRKRSIAERAVHPMALTVWRCITNGAYAGLGLGTAVAFYRAYFFENERQLVHEAVAIRSDMTLERWNFTGARGCVMLMVATMPFVNEGNLMRRCMTGIGAGILSSSIYSWAGGDKGFKRSDINNPPFGSQ
jgi:hypothetical protein